MAASVMLGDTVKACKTSSRHCRVSSLESSSGGCTTDVDAEWLDSMRSARCSKSGRAALATCPGKSSAQTDRDQGE